MRRVGCLGLVIVLLLVGFAYDRWSIEQLRGQVRAISGKVQVSNGKEKGKEGKSDLVSALAETEKHTARAKELLRKKRVAEAQKELDQALASLKSARGLSSDIVGDAASILGKARRNAEQVFKKAWKDISEETKRK